MKIVLCLAAVLMLAAFTTALNPRIEINNEGEQLEGIAFYSGWFANGMRGGAFNFFLGAEDFGLKFYVDYSQPHARAAFLVPITQGHGVERGVSLGNQTNVFNALFVKQLSDGAGNSCSVQQACGFGNVQPPVAVDDARIKALEARITALEASCGSRLKAVKNA